MKVEKILELLKFKEGAQYEKENIDATELVEEWNRQLNGMKKNYGEEVATKTLNELLSKYNLESEDSIKKLIESTKTKEQQESEELKAIREQVESLQKNLQEKDNELLKNNQMLSLKKIDLGDGKIAKVRDDKLQFAHQLISAQVSEEKDFATATKEFIASTPEWLEGTKNPQVNLGDDRNETNNDKNDSVEKYW